MYLVKDLKGNKKGFYINRKPRENVGPLLNGAGALVTKEMEKAKVLNAFFTSSLVVRPAFRNPRPLRAMGKSGARKTYPWWMRIRLRNI